MRNRSKLSQLVKGSFSLCLFVVTYTPFLLIWIPYLPLYLISECKVQRKVKDSIRKYKWKPRGGGVLSEKSQVYTILSLPYMLILAFTLSFFYTWKIALAFFFLYPLVILSAVWLYDRSEDAWNDCRARFYSVFD